MDKLNAGPCEQPYTHAYYISFQGQWNIQIHYQTVNNHRDQVFNVPLIPDRLPI